MKYCFILNPSAGKGEGIYEVRERIEACYKQSDTKVEIYETTGFGDASDYVIRTVAEQPHEDYRFYAAGGDGTLCEVVNGAMRSGSDRVAVGVIPSGTGNDFARNFTFSDNFFDIEAQMQAEEILVDLIRCNEMYAVNMVNIGFDSQVVVKTAKLKKCALIPSRLAYVAGLVVTLIRKPTLRAKVSLDDGEAEDKHYLLNTYANGSFCGGGFYSNPLADMQDGRMDAMQVKAVGRMKFVSLVGDYKKGTHLQEKFKDIVDNPKAKTVDMIFDREIPVCVDGEIMFAKELHLSVCPKALRFLVPSGSRLSQIQKEETASAEEVATV